MRTTGTKNHQKHTAYWYGKTYGIVHSDETSYTMRYLDFLQANQFRYRSFDKLRQDAVFDPFAFSVYLAADIGLMMRNEVKKLKNPDERARLKKELQRCARKVLRPTYYAQETARRRELAAERRRLRHRTTLAAKPTPEALLEAWNRRKESKERMIILGGMLHDLECYTDNCLCFDDNGNVTGRNRGIRGWIKDNLPGLNGKYKTLMRYKAMAIKLRQATRTKDPVPTAKLLEKVEYPNQSMANKKDQNRNHIKAAALQKKPVGNADNQKTCTLSAGESKNKYRNEVVARIFEGTENTFKSIMDVLDEYLSPDKVFYDGLSMRRVSRMA